MSTIHYPVRPSSQNNKPYRTWSWLWKRQQRRERGRQQLPKALLDTLLYMDLPMNSYPLTTKRLYGEDK